MTITLLYLIFPQQSLDVFKQLYRYTRVLSFVHPCCSLKNISVLMISIIDNYLMLCKQHTYLNRKVPVMEHRDSHNVSVNSDTDSSSSLTINADGPEENETNTKRYA